MTWFVEHLHRDGSVLARVPVHHAVLRIGRDLGNDLVIDDPHCAAHHAEVRMASDDSAELHDLGTKNGIRPPRGKRQPHYSLSSDTVYRLGNSHIRIRNSAWPVPAELALSLHSTWPLALLAMALVLARGVWDVWLTDLRNTPPAYLYPMSGAAAALAVWSAAYALLGRILSGVDRFFTHLLIVGCAFLAGTALHVLLQVLAFSSAWLWPIRITPYVTILVVALTVRAHLRVADPRHWPVTRWGVAVATALAITVPLAQTWITDKRLTNVQVLSTVEHPALRLAQPIGIAEFMDATQPLKTQVDQGRRDHHDGADADASEFDVTDTD